MTCLDTGLSLRACEHGSDWCKPQGEIDPPRHGCKGGRSILARKPGLLKRWLGMREAGGRSETRPYSFPKGRQINEVARTKGYNEDSETGRPGGHWGLALSIEAHGGHSRGEERSGSLFAKDQLRIGAGENYLCFVHMSDQTSKETYRNFSPMITFNLTDWRF